MNLKHRNDSCMVSLPIYRVVKLWGYTSRLEVGYRSKAVTVNFALFLEDEQWFENHDPAHLMSYSPIWIQLSHVPLHVTVKWASSFRDIPLPKDVFPHRRSVGRKGELLSLWNPPWWEMSHHVLISMADVNKGEVSSGYLQIHIKATLHAS